MNEIQINQVLKNFDTQKDIFDLGWLIGIIEGEGTFLLYKKKCSQRNPISYGVKIVIYNTNLKIIENIERILKNFYIKYTTQKVIRDSKRKISYQVVIQSFANLKRLFDIFGDKFPCRKEKPKILKEYVKLRLSKYNKNIVLDEEHQLFIKFNQITE